MGRKTLCVANIAEDADPTQLSEVFNPFGTVEDITWDFNERFNVHNALVTLDLEKNATKANASLNGTTFLGQRLSLSYAEVDADTIQRGLSRKARETAEGVCRTLGEIYRKPVRRIHTMVLLCGHSFVTALVEEAQEIHAGEGILTLDGTRKRSLGGVFFHLALPRMSPDIYLTVHPRGGKLPGYQKMDDRAIYHLIQNPHQFDMDYYHQVVAEGNG